MQLTEDQYAEASDVVLNALVPILSKYVNPLPPEDQRVNVFALCVALSMKWFVSTSRAYGLDVNEAKDLAYDAINELYDEMQEN